MSVPKSIPVIFTRPYGQHFNELYKHLEGESGITIYDEENLRDVVAIIKEHGGGLILVGVAQKELMAKQLTLLKVLSKHIERRSVRVIGIFETDHPAILDLFSNHGCGDILPSSTPFRSLKFKIDRYLEVWKRAFEQLRKMESERESEELKEFEATPISFVEGLEIKEDYWFYEKDNAKQILGKWAIRLKGPMSDIGDWYEIPNNSGPAWEFIITDVYLKEYQLRKETWIFEGEKPQFKNGYWYFVAKKPKLTYNKKEIRIQVNTEGRLVLSENSSLAESIIEEFREGVLNEKKRRSFEHDKITDKDPSTKSDHQEFGTSELLERVKENLKAYAYEMEKAGKSKENSSEIELEVENENPFSNQSILEKFEKLLNLHSKPPAEDVANSEKKVFKNQAEAEAYTREKIKSIHPVHPEYGPLGFAFLISELMNYNQADSREVLKKAILYLESAFPDVLFRIWRKVGFWSILDESKSLFEMSNRNIEVESLEMIIANGEKSGTFVDTDHSMKVVFIQRKDGSAAGAVSLHGPLHDHFDEKIISSASQSLYGIVESIDVDEAS